MCNVTGGGGGGGSGWGCSGAGGGFRMQDAGGALAEDTGNLSLTLTLTLTLGWGVGSGGWGCRGTGGGRPGERVCPTLGSGCQASLMANWIPFDSDTLNKMSQDGVPTAGHWEPFHVGETKAVHSLEHNMAQLVVTEFQLSGKNSSKALLQSVPFSWSASAMF